jgi:hypothetical protein
VQRQIAETVNGRIRHRYIDCGPSRAVPHKDSRVEPSPVAVAKPAPAPTPDEDRRRLLATI